MKKLILPFLLLSCLGFSAQNMPQVIPPSPETQEFNKYINFDVSLYNGLAEIYIPLYTINLKGLEIPVSLSYHASGIKMGQTDGEVGVGWVFNPGHRISRTIYGLPDEDAPKPDDILQTLQNYGYPGPERDEYLSKFLSETNYQSQPYTQYSLKLDGEFDQFNYSIPTESGSFIISNRTTNEIATMAQSSIKIDYSSTNDLITGLKATDNMGVDYYFGNQLSTSNAVFENSSLGGGLKTAWALTDLETPFGEQVHFAYNLGSAGGWNSHIKSFTFYENDLRYNNINSFYNWTDGIDNSYSTFFLKEINSSKEKIVIERNETNQITQIEIRTPENSLVKKIAFYYGVTGHTFLDSLKIFDRNNVEVKSYRFQYYNRNENGLNFSHDQWGYCMKYGFSGSPSVHLYHEEFFDDIIKTNGSPNGTSLTAIFDEQAERSSLGQFAVPSYFSLKKITYPTGGSTEYFYDHNKFKIFGNINYGGGIRIKQIKKYDNNGNNMLVRDYKYGENEDGTGTQIVPISHELFTGEGILFYPSSNPDYVRQQRMITYNTTLQGDIDPGGFLSSNVIYPKVTEYFTSNSDVDDKAGKIEYNYNLNHTYNADNLLPVGSFQPVENVGFQYWPLSPLYVNRYLTWNKPLLREKRLYALDNLAYNLIKKEQYVYQGSYDTYEGLKVRPFAYANNYNSLISDYYQYIPSFFSYDTYSITCGKNLLTEKKETFYSEGGSLVVHKTYDYNNFKQLVEETIIGSNNGIIKRKLDYPKEMVDTGKDPLGIYQSMFSQNILSPVIENYTFKNNNQVSLVRTNYSSKNGMYLPESMETLKGTEAIPEQRIQFHRYDERGNPLEVSKADGPRIVYLWGYSKQYPIAKIENATYQEVANALDVSTTVLGTYAESNLPVINNLRAGLPQAMITTYTYEPLIGLKTITDPKGYIMTYTYDDFNRLEFIKDAEGNIIKEYKYNYKNQ